MMLLIGLSSLPWVLIGLLIIGLFLLGVYVIINKFFPAEWQPYARAIVLLAAIIIAIVFLISLLPGGKFGN